MRPDDLIHLQNGNHLEPEVQTRIEVAAPGWKKLKRSGPNRSRCCTDKADRARRYLSAATDCVGATIWRAAIVSSPSGLRSAGSSTRKLPRLPNSEGSRVLEQGCHYKPSSLLIAKGSGEGGVEVSSRQYLAQAGTQLGTKIITNRTCASPRGAFKVTSSGHGAHACFSHVQAL